jgi:cobalt/nickel transport system permease protein
LDPRIKISTFLLFIIIIGLARSFWVLSVLVILIVTLCLLSRVPLWFFFKRAFLFIPIFTVVIALPALFITPGEPLLHLVGNVVVTEQGARSAGLLVLRVTDSLSFGILLILTTPWNNFLMALRWLKVPSLMVDILGMTYRYIFVLLHTVNSMFLARQSRSLEGFSGSENRRWLARTLAATLAKSQHLSQEVYLAMLSRGYQGEIYSLNRLSLRQGDYFWSVFVLVTASVLLWGTYR